MFVSNNYSESSIDLIAAFIILNCIQIAPWFSNFAFCVNGSVCNLMLIWTKSKYYQQSDLNMFLNKLICEDLKQLEYSALICYCIQKEYIQNEMVEKILDLDLNTHIFTQILKQTSDSMLNEAKYFITEENIHYYMNKLIQNYELYAGFEQFEILACFSYYLRIEPQNEIIHNFYSILNQIYNQQSNSREIIKILIQIWAELLMLRINRINDALFEQFQQWIVEFNDWDLFKIYIVGMQSWVIEDGVIATICLKGMEEKECGELKEYFETRTDQKQRIKEIVNIDYLDE
ncbi:Hypothetical_protein [Hexamita inflata]|uniref:Hypothetical_protein n=1 Tax=Hexamita inflata TaxID=28002 RepID=A0AA86N796_9EUKA|nr:Hypothetical protein HINF_LOCUS1780 [Hexamita inflata]